MQAAEATSRAGGRQAVARGAGDSTRVFGSGVECMCEVGYPKKCLTIDMISALC
jgi:hypothetical protein